MHTNNYQAPIQQVDLLTSFISLNSSLEEIKESSKTGRRVKYLDQSASGNFYTTYYRPNKNEIELLLTTYDELLYQEEGLKIKLAKIVSKHPEYENDLKSEEVNDLRLFDCSKYERICDTDISDFLHLDKHIEERVESPPPSPQSSSPGASSPTSSVSTLEIDSDRE